MRSTFGRSCPSVVVLGAVLVVAGARAHDIIINEIHYNPLGPGADGDLEFVELHNLSGETIDLGGWWFGEGITYACPRGLQIGPREYLVFSRDPERLRSEHGLARAIGPYEGRLDNDGEVVSLHDAEGRMVSRVHYADEGPWPTLPDGFGPSLEFTGEDDGNDVHSRWAASAVIGGTPGARNSTYAPPATVPESGGTDLIPSTAVFRTFKGTAAPSNPALAWTDPGFDDAAWAALPGAFGFGNLQGLTYTTQLGDMQGRYSTFYLRGEFALDEEDHAAFLAGEKKLSVRVVYDDAFVAYLNGVEIGRDNVGTAGTAVAYNANAASDRSSELEIVLSSSGPVHAGTNVLAVQGVNARGFGPFGQDFFIGASVTAEDVAAPPPPPESEGKLIPGAINEYRPGGPGVGYIELYNPRSEALDLGGFVLRLGRGPTYELPSAAQLEPGAFQAIGASVLGFDLPSEDTTCVLLAADGRTLVDAVKAPAPRAPGVSAGRHPDGSDDVFVLLEATEGSPNSAPPFAPVVIHEICFHPTFVPPGDGCIVRCSDPRQWIEIWNSGVADVDLTGWALTKGVAFDFPAGTTLPAGQGLVVAASVAAFGAAHPEVTNVVGGWSGRLSHASDTINLRDALGNRVDHVKYGDGQPANDEAPIDGVDDRTFRGSPWPTGADGTGRTLELVSPEVDNRFGLSWRISSADGGTPGAQNSVHDPDPGPVVDDASHSPAVPISSEAVKVTCRISAPRGVQEASVEWSRDATNFTAAPLADDGLGPDKKAGNGVFSAEIPPQPDGAIVLFRIRVTDQEGRSIVVPVSPAVPPYAGALGPFFLYEVDDAAEPANGSPVYRIVMAPRDLQQLRSRDVNSDVLLPCTFIAGDEVHHLAGLRFRGETSRREANRSYRVDFPSESLFDGVEHLNLNASNGGGAGASIVTEFLACDLFRRAGMPYSQMVAVNLHFAGEVARDWDSRFGRKENIDGQFLHRFFGGSDEGNLYRARNPDGPGRPSGDLSYLGANPESYRALYEKKSNREEDDFSDIIALTRAFSATETPDAVFADELEALIDPAEWARFFAIQDIITNNDGGIWNNNGEDYFLYRVPADSSRPDKGKFLLIPWDLEESFTDEEGRLFVVQVATVRRFLTNPRFAPLYYAELAAMRDGPLSRHEMRRHYGFVSRMFRAADVFDVVDPLDSYVTARLGYLEENVSPALSAGPVSSTVAGTPVISPGDAWRFFRGRTAPPGDGEAWTGLEYDDAAWESGPTGIGYGDNDDATVLSDMRDNYGTIFARKTFEVDDPTTVASLTLLVDYDDAFVAYVNGHEVARSASAPGSPGSPVSFDDFATTGHEIAGAQSFQVSPAAAQLVAGTNVLAAVVLNDDIGSSDVSFVPTLLVSAMGQQGSIAGGCGGPILATGTEVLLSGTADAAVTRAVRVGGELAALSFVTTGNGPFGATWSARVAIEPGDNLVRITAHPDVDGLEAAVLTTEIVVRRFEGAFAPVGGTLATDTSWPASGGPYRLVQTVQVPAGITLTIGPGAVILGDGGTGIVVRGRLEANGEEGNPIRLGAFSCDDPWGGITIQDTGIEADSPVQVLRHCVIEHASGLAGARGVVAPTASRLLLDGCTLRSLGSNAVDGSNAEVVVQRCLFEDIGEGVHCTSSLVVIEDSTFRGMIGDSDAIDFDATARGRCRIARCAIEDGADDGVDLAAASVDILDNRFSGLGDKAISFEGDGPDGGPVASGNVIRASGTGMALKDGVTVTGDHNTVTECQEGISLFAKDAGPQGGHGIFHSLIVWNNFQDVLLDAKSTVEISWSDIGGEEPWPGEGNISGPPLFAAPARRDYSLAGGSPCIGSGRDGSDMGAIPASVEPPVTFVRGDANDSGVVDISDAIATLRFLFMEGETPRCQDGMDADDDGAVNITDPIYGLQYLFQGGPVLPPPYPEAGVDATEDSLPCA